MKKQPWHSTIFTALCIGGFAFLIDRLTKAWVVSSLKTTYQITDFLWLHAAINRGITFSLFSFEQTIPFIIVSCIVAAAFIFFVHYTLVRWMQHKSILGETLVIAGALSNLIDRVLYGGVIDFIIVGYRDWFWPTFNVADMCIVVGICLMFIQGYKETVKIQTLCLQIATLGRLGYMTASGTLASLCMIPLIYAAYYFNISLPLQAVILLVVTIASFFIIQTAATESRMPDPSYIVLDECIGMLIVMFGIPFSFYGCFIGFLLFRLFDISKMFGISRIEQLPGAWGILLDDVVAALLANIILRFLLPLGCS